MTRLIHILLTVAALLAFAAPAAAAESATDAAGSQAATPAVAVALDARLAGDLKRTRLIVDLDRMVDFRVFPLADPYRLIVDLPQVDFRLDDRTGAKGRGFVTAFRYGLIFTGRSRIVMDLAGPGRIDKAFILEPVEDQPARLVIDIVESTREAFLAAVDKASGEMALAAAPPPPAARRDPGKPLIVIDPGHGGIDPGAVSGSHREKDVVLAVARHLKEEIDASGDMEAILTRDEDVFIPLAARVQFARDHGAALMISLHADSLNVPEVGGATVYTLSDSASDALSARLAEQENRSDAIAGVDLSEEPDEVASILIDLIRRETKNLSVSFARSLVSGLRPTTRLNKNPHRSAGFWVLKAPEVPSVLIELGYMTNEADVESMSDDAWQTRMAKAIARAVHGHLVPRKEGSVASN